MMKYRVAACDGFLILMGLDGESTLSGNQVGELKEVMVITTAQSEIARLEQELAKAREKLATVEEQLTERPDFGLGQGGTMLYEWEMNLAERDRLREKIASLEDALERAREGRYGICEVCGQPIDPERLKILPDTKLCAKCAAARR
ncbi:MAG: TraR/DksA C4-type zinc finger protein [Anaerolineae bacterium]|nr:TraR/DksA C4-type zinc finger protein [Anaerolineae bacterium]